MSRCPPKTPGQMDDIEIMVLYSAGYEEKQRALAGIGPPWSELKETLMLELRDQIERRKLGFAIDASEEANYEQARIARKGLV